ncbi:hypothetical protein HIM_02089 [Hirsutella minnesotensis 3608]|nr:hypothetical protein HIM_02089 [Hirsutella minnesotensis 3608]
MASPALIPALPPTLSEPGGELPVDSADEFSESDDCDDFHDNDDWDGQPWEGLHPLRRALRRFFESLRHVCHLRKSSVGLLGQARVHAAGTAGAVEAPRQLELGKSLLSRRERVDVGYGDFRVGRDCRGGVNVVGEGLRLEEIVGAWAAVVVEALFQSQLLARSLTDETLRLHLLQVR